MWGWSEALALIGRYAIYASIKAAGTAVKTASHMEKTGGTSPGSGGVTVSTQTRRCERESLGPLRCWVDLGNMLMRDAACGKCYFLAQHLCGASPKCFTIACSLSDPRDHAGPTDHQLRLGSYTTRRTLRARNGFPQFSYETH